MTSTIKTAIAESIATNSVVTIEVDDHADAIATLSALSDSQLEQDGDTCRGTDDDGNEWAIRLA